MRIIHLISGGDVGGAKTHVHTLLQGLCASETVQLVCFTDGPFATEAKALGIPTKVLVANLPDTVRRLTELIRERQFDMIHCHGARANMVGALLKRKLAVPVVSTVHSDYRLDYMGRPLAALTFGMVNRIALRQLDSWIGVSDAMGDMLIDRGFPPERIYSIYNGVRFDIGQPPLSRDEYLRSLGISYNENSVVFGIAARINPVKDMTTLVRAFARAVKACPDARLIIAGDGIQRQEIEQLAQELCPPGTVTFAGWIDDTLSFYNALNVNLLTSLSETFPYALTEGARMRCATIASRVGGVPRLIDHELNGLLFEPKDIDTLAAHMTALAGNPALCRSLGEQLYEKTKREFSVEATVEQQKRIYKSILCRRERSRLKHRDGVMICGAYGKGNSGDDAILAAIITQLRRLDAELPICVLSRNPKQTARENRVEAIFTFNYLKLWKKMRHTAVYLSGGGSLIQDATSNRSLWYYLSSIRSAKNRGNKVLMFGCGIGPVSRKRNRRRAAAVLNRYVDEITLRDDESGKELMRLGVNGVPVQVTADMAFLLERAPVGEQTVYARKCGLQPDGRYILFALRPWTGVEKRKEAFLQTAVYANSHYGLTPVFYAMEPTRDAPICEELAASLREKGVACLCLKSPENAQLVFGLIGSMRAVVAMRLHALIFAASQAVPMAGIAYDPKVSSFLTRMGVENYCRIEEADFNRLQALVDRAMNAEQPDGQKAQELQRLAQLNCETAMRLLTRQ